MDRSVSSYNVIWRSPSDDELGAMPIGNGDLAASVWVEPDGAIRFYLAKNDAWSEVHRLLKLGRLRLEITPGAPVEFEQRLDLADGAIRLRVDGVGVRCWIDAQHPAVHIEIDSDTPVTPVLTSEPWRLAEKHFTPEEEGSAYGQGSSEGNVNPIPPTESADREWTPTADTPVLGGWHRNLHSIYAENLRRQGAAALLASEPDPLLHRTFGWLAMGDGLAPDGPRALRGARPSRRWHLVIVGLTAQTPTEEAWQQQAFTLLHEISALNPDAAFAAHRAWWQAFWHRSYVHIDTPGSDDGFDLSQAWHLFRFLCAAMSRGDYPVKFNGGLFNVGMPGALGQGGDCDADYRQWGGPFWHQNTRQIYWPLLASGDTDLMAPFFHLYTRNLAAAAHRTRCWFGHNGGFFPETMYLWGAYVDDNYGYDRTGKALDYVQNNYVYRHWQGNLETVAMALDRYAYAPDAAFLHEVLLPLAREAVTFYDEHYPRVNGRLHMEPAQALETLWDVVDPAPDIAGLEYVLDGLLALPGVDEVFAERCRRLRSELPPLPIRQIAGETVLTAAAEIRCSETNAENLTMYAVFPYRRHCLLHGDPAIARASYGRRVHRGYTCWSNDNVFAAFLGMADEARSHLPERVRYNRNVRLFTDQLLQFRFPSMVGAGEHGLADWVPDLDNLGVVQQAIQGMLVQSDGARILPFPAWPPDWNAAFHLHVPGGMVEGRWQDGQLVRWEETGRNR